MDLLNSALGIALNQSPEKLSFRELPTRWCDTMKDTG